MKGLTVIRLDITPILLGASSSHQNFTSGLLLQSLLIRTTWPDDQTSIVKFGVSRHVDLSLNFVGVVNGLTKRIDSVGVAHSGAVGIIGDISGVIGGTGLHFAGEARDGEHISEEVALFLLEGFGFRCEFSVGVQHGLHNLAVLVADYGRVVAL